MPRACIALGSNLGDRARMLDRAVELIAALPATRLIARSDNLPTVPQEGGPGGQGDYLNGAVVVETDIGPRDLLSRLRQIELLLGREPDERREYHGPRTIDLDLLLYDNVTLDEPEIRLPHPRMHARRFVLEPLAQVAGETVHPLLGRTVRELLESLPQAR